MSKGNPLTQEEVQQLLVVKSQLDNETWEKWLVLAREEKRSRFNFAANGHPNETKGLVAKPAAHDEALGAMADTAANLASHAAAHGLDKALPMNAGMSFEATAKVKATANPVPLATDPAQQRELEKQRMRESATVPVSVMREMKQR